MAGAGDRRRHGRRRRGVEMHTRFVPVPSDGPDQERSSGLLHVSVKAPDERAVGRAFSAAAIELALANYPGFFATGPPGAASAYGVFWPALVPADEIDQVVVLDDGATSASIRRRPARRRGRRPPHGLDAGRCDRAGHAARTAFRRPLRRQGRQRQRRRLGPRRRRLRLVGSEPDRRADPRAAPGVRRPGDPALRAGQPAGAELRARRLPRRGCRQLDIVRPAGQGPRRVPPLRLA